MSRQFIDYTTSANLPPNAPANDGLDTGDENDVAVRPVVNGEAVVDAVLKRPTENLRTRTEIVRDALNDVKYLTDADRALVITSRASVAWNYGTGSFTSDNDIILRPFMAPSASSASRLIICAGTASQITIRTRQDGVVGQPRAYSGANQFSFDFQPVDLGGTGVVTITFTGLTDLPVFGGIRPKVHVQFDSNPAGGTTVLQMLNYLNNVTPTLGGAQFISYGLEAVVDGTAGATAQSLGPNGGPNEVGFPTPPLPVLGNKVYLTLAPAEAVTRFMAGAADAEKHIITQAHLTTFFADPLNAMVDGDVLCIRYDDLVMPLDGGRRQSLNEFPENKAYDAGLNLFLLRRFPERLPGAIPFATVTAQRQLIFINNRVIENGETGPLVSGGADYQGSNAAPNSWADNTVVAGPITFEDALDTIIQTLGAKTGTVGAAKIGMSAITINAVNTVAGSLSTTVNAIVTGVEAHRTNPTGAHASTAISSPGFVIDGVPTASGSVATAVTGLVTGINAHITDLVDAHDASAISTTLIGGTPVNTPAANVQSTLAAVVAGVNTHVVNPLDAHDASAISYNGAPNLVSVNVEAALDELDAEKAGLSLANTYTGGGLQTFSGNVTVPAASDYLYTGNKSYTPLVSLTDFKASAGLTFVAAGYGGGYWTLPTAGVGTITRFINIPAGATVTNYQINLEYTAPGVGINVTATCHFQSATVSGPGVTLVTLASNAITKVAGGALAWHVPGGFVPFTVPANSPLAFTINFSAPGDATNFALFGIQIFYHISGVQTLASL